MAPADPVGEPIWRDLDVPRAPSEPERRLLLALAAAVDEPLLHGQVERVLVDAVCRCGCPSVRLRSEEPPIPGAAVARLSARGRDDHFAVEATGHGPEGRSVSIVLHVVEGRVHELELFAEAEGALRAADVTDVNDPWVG